MKHILSLAVALSLTVAPLSAQDTEPDAAPEDDGFNLMEEGAKLFFRGMQDEAGPVLEELRGMSDEMREAMRAFASDMGPALLEMARLIDEIRYYDAPEVLENGDIVIRRRSDAPPYERPETAEEPEEIEL